ncbi:MAG: outer membrane beta-barrel protein, partial [Bacteroides sp.]|nr:outer membrane beta-barrel protein [Bacteroides sp.]
YFINAGPYLGFLINANTQTKNIEGYPDTKNDFTENYKRSDWGISAGLGIAIPIGSKLSLSLEVRNNLGLSQINTGDVWQGGYVKTNATNLLVGAAYHFPRSTSF